MALFVSNSTSKHVMRFQEYPGMPHMIYKYLDFKKIFISSLDTDVRMHLLYRPHFNQYGWLEKELDLIKKYPEIEINQKGKLIELLKSVKLYICDHQGTSFMEALVVNTPTIIFWDNQYANRKGAERSFDILIQSGILFYDPKEAASKVNLIWDDVKGWWMHKDRQQARKEFINSQCMIDKDCFGKWVDTFKNILNNPGYINREDSLKKR
ncbi:sphingosine kinase and enzymes related to eukaryotic diacylglycerol kinase [Candidatus Scalindua japonica]|uniref:Sphingosine kinase and enzymes related to eukaryotic diacylglycerol kinase n=2 Tax=Candidatus Scalindua japonica TaxID=1284222 RepID=A0A286U469_9BACT|nr:sphingosine kinase and enzymes related to eukaryotic diacylglycerol kinase [Candidatus Scalindua japonica]